MTSSIVKRGASFLIITLLCMLFIFFPSNDTEVYASAVEDFRLKENRIGVVNRIVSTSETDGENVEFEDPSTRETRHTETEEDTQDLPASLDDLQFATGMPESAIALNTEVYNVATHYASKLDATQQQRDLIKLFTLSVVDVEGRVISTHNKWKIVGVPPSLELYEQNPQSLKFYVKETNNYGIVDGWTNIAQGPYQIVNIEHWNKTPADNDNYLSLGRTNFYGTNNMVTGAVHNRFVVEGKQYADWDNKYYMLNTMYMHHWMPMLYQSEKYQTMSGSDGANNEFAVKWARWCSKPEYVDAMREIVMAEKPANFYFINNSDPAGAIARLATKARDDALASDPNFFANYLPSNWSPGSGAAAPTYLSFGTQGIYAPFKITMSSMIVEERFNGSW